MFCYSGKMCPNLLYVFMSSLFTEKRQRDSRLSLEDTNYLNGYIDLKQCSSWNVRRAEQRLITFLHVKIKLQSQPMKACILKSFKKKHLLTYYHSEKSAYKKYFAEKLFE